MPARADSESARPAGMVLLGRPDDLQALHGQADLPAHFLSLFRGGLYETASSGPADLLTLLGRYHVVGLDVGILSSRSGDGPGDRREQRYRDNLSQALATRRVVLLSVLHAVEVGAGVCHLGFLREGALADLPIACRPGQQTVEELLQALEASGLQVSVEADDASACARLRVEDRGGEPLCGAKCTGSCDLADLLGFEVDEGALVSRWFSSGLADAACELAALLQDCAERRERSILEAVVSTWLETHERMQAHTQLFTRFELVVVANRAYTRADRELLERFSAHGRVWLMTEQLRAGGNMQELVHASYVWPDAVASLLARLDVLGPTDTGRGFFGWRSFTFGARAEDGRVERLREQQTTKLLEEVDGEPEPPKIEPVGPFQPIDVAWQIDRKQPGEDLLDWDAGHLAHEVRSAADEQDWCADHRDAGHGLGQARMRLGREWTNPETEDPERLYAQGYWREIHKRPGVLRRFAEGRHLRGKTDLLQILRSHRAQWQDLLNRRRAVAEAREALTQQAEEVDRARDFHLGALPRLAVGAVVSCFVGFLCLNLIRVLLLISPTTWFTGALMFLLALSGGFAGALLPAWIERRRGVAVAGTLARDLERLDAEQRRIVEDSRELFRDAEEARQSLRKDSVRQRTVLLAERAWAIVRETQDKVKGEFHQRKLLGAVASGGHSREAIALQDRQEWRRAAQIVPEAALDLEHDSEAWDKEFDHVARTFLEEWKQALDEEDGLETGFLRAAVLRELVVRLSDDVVEVIEKALWQQITRAVKAKSIKMNAWSAPFGRAIGRDLKLGALFSVHYRGDLGDDAGSYLWIHRDGGFAPKLLDAILREFQSRFGNLRPASVPVQQSVPLGGFATLFHELEVEWHADGAGGELSLRPVGVGEASDDEGKLA